MNSLDDLFMSLYQPLTVLRRMPSSPRRRALPSVDVCAPDPMLPWGMHEHVRVVEPSVAILEGTRHRRQVPSASELHG